MRITKKFGSLELDIYNSTYDFSKLAYISKINELASRPKPLTAGSPSQSGPRISGTKQGTGTNRLEFAYGELSGDSTGTTVIPMTLRTHRASYLGRFSMRRVMAALMAA